MTAQTAEPQVVVVTGASGGVGRAIAHAFAKRGAHVGLLARGREGLDGAAERSSASAARRSLSPPTSPSTSRSRRRAVAVEERFGEIDVWVNDAMATVFARVPRHRARGVQARHRSHLSRHGVRHDGRAEADDGTRSRERSCRSARRSSYRAIPLQAAYCGAKFAIRGFTDSIRTELRHDKSNVQITMVQLPGVNTTQFSWCRSKLPDHPMPVPPIYQPEIPAEAVYWAAQHRRRELWVGYSAVEAILGSSFAPGALGDWYLARTGISGQQVKDMPLEGERTGNLFEPVEADAATHGIFDAQAKTRSPQLWVATHRGIARRRSGWGRSRRCRRWRRGSRGERRRHGRGGVGSSSRTCCASTRCSPTVSAACSSARAATSPGCASRAGTPPLCSPRSSAAAAATPSRRASGASGAATTSRAA